MIKSDNNKHAEKIAEEVFNSIVHGLGVIAAIVGLVLGIIFMSSSTFFKVGFIVYSASLIILMLASTLYHALKFTKANKILQSIDHGSIFILIAGSFTPFIIYLYNGWLEITLLALVWVIAVSGISVTATILLPKKIKWAELVFYLSFGWMALFFIPKINLLGSTVLWLLILGGVLYTVGVIPYALKKPFAHFSWHLFVVAAAAAQFFAVINLV